MLQSWSPEQNCLCLAETKLSMTSLIRHDSDRLLKTNFHIHLPEILAFQVIEEGLELVRRLAGETP